MEVRMRSLLACTMGVWLIFSGCGKSPGGQSKEAIKAAIEQHLQQRSNVVYNNMTLEIQNVKFEGDRAEADVRFQSKQSPQAAVNVHYTLKKVGDRWQVESSSSGAGMGGHGTGGSPHGGAPSSGPEPEPSH
jgi:hypothetical protein